MSIPREYALNYGEKSFSIFVPGEYQCQLLQPAVSPIQLDEKDILKIRLNNPLATSKLEDILSAKDRILIVVPDKTRVSRLDLVFPHIFKILQKKNIPDKQVIILFANGCHPNMTEEEKRAILGEAVYYRFIHYEHNCTQAMVDHLGTTSRGTSVMVNHLLSKFDKIVVISSVVHHYFAGFGGGPKMIVPALAAMDTIWHNHRMAVMAEDSPLHPACEPGNTVNNPVYDDIIEASKMVNVDFAIQLVLNENHRLVDAFCGNLYSSYQKACMRVHQLNTAPVPQLADLVIASVGGYPKDINLVQSHKAIHHAVRALKPAGNLIVLAECSDGWGNPELLSWFKIDSYQKMKKMVMENYRLNGNTALVLKHKLDTYQIHLISELADNRTKEIGFYPHSDIQSALDTVYQKLAENALVYVIPYASITLPVIE